MSYQYSKTDVRTTPSMYMYARYDGINFLQAYRESRLADIANLRQNNANTAAHESDPLVTLCYRWHRNASKLDATTTTRFLSNNLYAPGYTTVDTTHTLTLCCYKLLENDPAYFRLANQWITILAGKFERAKCLRKEYDKALRPIDNNDAGYRAYTLLAAALAIALSREINLHYLNALLKLNDFLIAKMEALGSVLAALLLVTLEKELYYVDCLSETCKVKIDAPVVV